MTSPVPALHDKAALKPPPRRAHTLATISERTPVVAHGLDARGETLAIAEDRVPLTRVVRYKVDGLAEKDFASTFATVALFGGVALGLLIMVISLGWRDRFYLAAILTGAIAIFAVVDLHRVKWLTTFTFTLTLDDGTDRTFVTNSEHMALRLRHLLDARLDL